MCEETAVYIFRRRNNIAQATEVLSYLNTVLEQENQLHQHELVCFLHDCYRQAVNKSLKLQEGKTAIFKITKKWKDYHLYVDLIPLITKNKINPFAFFSFIVQARKSKKIPCTIRNVATAKAVSHYLSYLKSNSYRVSTYINFKDYEQGLYNQFNIDLISLTAYLLRKPNVALNANETWLFSSPSKVMVAMSNNQVVQLTDSEKVFYEDLLFDPAFCSRLTLQWNKTVEIQISRVGAMYHQLREELYLAKLGAVQKLLNVLKVR